MTAAEEAARAALIETCLAMNASGINQGTSGNVSVRWGEGLLITPSALAYAAMTPADIVYLAPDGTPQGARPPSSEWRFHRDILMARPDVEAVVHCHSTFATALACHSQDIPAFHYMVAVAGGTSIRCADYATFGGQELSDAALVALRWADGLPVGPAWPDQPWRQFGQGAVVGGRGRDLGQDVCPCPRPRRATGFVG